MLMKVFSKSKNYEEKQLRRVNTLEDNMFVVDIHCEKNIAG